VEGSEKDFFSDAGKLAYSVKVLTGGNIKVGLPSVVSLFSRSLSSLTPLLAFSLSI
jgi:hypothetical protein